MIEDQGGVDTLMHHRYEICYVTLATDLVDDILSARRCACTLATIVIMGSTACLSVYNNAYATQSMHHLATIFLDRLGSRLGICIGPRRLYPSCRL